MAGGVDQRAANPSGSAAAIAAGSIVPNRVSTLCGPRKACSMGYCWSSIIPTSRANGLALSTWSASGSPVMWMAMTAILTHRRSRTHRAAPRTPPGGLGPDSVGLDRQHRAVGVEQDPLGVAAEDQLADGRTPPQPDHDEIGVDLLGDVEQVLGGFETGLGAAHVDVDP